MTTISSASQRTHLSKGAQPSERGALLEPPRADAATLAVPFDDPRSARALAGAALPRRHVSPSCASSSGWLSRLGALFGTVRPAVAAVAIGASLLSMPAAHAAPRIVPNASVIAARAFDEAALAPELRAVLRTELDRHARGSSAAQTLRALVADPGFGQLATDEAVRLVRLVGGTNEQLSTPARGAIARVLAEPAFVASDAGARGERLRTFVTAHEGARFLVDSSEATVRAPFVLGAASEVASFEFRSGAAAAQVQTLGLDGRLIRVVTPASTSPDDGQFHSANELARGLASLPRAVRLLVDELVIEPKRNPEDATWAALWGDPLMRSYMTAGGARITVYPTLGRPSQAVLDGSIAHEAGHLLSDARLGPVGALGWTAWTAARASDVIAPSHYGLRAENEDFAETFHLYVRTAGTAAGEELRTLMPARWAIVDGLVDRGGP